MEVLRTSKVYNRSQRESSGSVPKESNGNYTLVSVTDYDAFTVGEGHTASTTISSVHDSVKQMLL